MLSPRARDMPASNAPECGAVWSHGSRVAGEGRGFAVIAHSRWAARSSRGVGGRCESTTTATSRAGLERPFVADLRRFARSARWHASCSKGEHEPLDFADRAAPRWTHDDGVAPLSKESQPSPLAAADVRGRSGDAAGAGASDAACARRTAAHARRGAVPRARQQPPGEDLSPRGAEVRAPGERRPQQASAAVPRRRARRLAAAALRLHVPGGLLRHLSGDGADPFDRRQDPHRGPVHDLVTAAVDQPLSQLYKINLGVKATELGREIAREGFAPSARRSPPRSEARTSISWRRRRRSTRCGRR